MSDIFSKIYVRPPKRSRIPLSHSVKLTTAFGRLTPILCVDTVPGDSFALDSAITVQAYPFLAPLLDMIECRVDYFFVPNRLLWDDWSTFITAGPQGISTPVHPYLSPLQVNSNFDTDHPSMICNNLCNYLGVPPIYNNNDPSHPFMLPESLPIDALPFRAYTKIYNEYYRDQNLQSVVEEFKTSGNNEDEMYSTCLYRCLKKDYFTSALPWAQRGPQVSIPLTGSAPVVLDDSVRDSHDGITTTPDIIDGSAVQSELDLYFRGNHNYSDGYQARTLVGSKGAGAESGIAVYASDPLGQNSDPVSIDGSIDSISLPGANVAFPESDVNRIVNAMSADLSDASAITINELRRLTSVQRWLEVNARGGARYIEQILSHFGVRTPDFRLDRPEYLGGSKSPILVNKITQTSQTTESSPLGNYAGDGVAASVNKSRRYFCQEHGWIIGIMSILPKVSYMQGLPKNLSRMDIFDYYFPEFQHLGEQAILNREIYAYNENKNNQAFGYTPRYAEYKYLPNRVCGDLCKSSMMYWHFGVDFGRQTPPLNGNFLDSEKWLNEFNRVFAVTEASQDQFIVSIFNKIRAKRPMKRHVIPKL